MTESHPFFSPKTHGFVRVAAATPVSHVGDPVANAQAHLALIRQAADQGVDLMVFPELSLSAYAIDDLHMQAALLDEVERQVAVLAQATGGATAEHELIAVVGAPLRHGDALFNCAVVMGGGEVLAVVPKTYLPNYREYYEKRWFAPATARTEDVIRLNGETVDFAPGLVFEAVNRPGFVFAVEICEDYWAPLPPSTRAALAGARILLNLSASNIVIGKADERAMLSASHSARTLSAYVFAASGWGESTTDLAWDGQATIHELGTKLAEGERFALENHLTIADIDVDRIGLDRLRNGTFADCARNEGEAATVVPFMARDVPPPGGRGTAKRWRGWGGPLRHGAARRATSPRGGGFALIRPLDRFPFVPDDAGRLDQDCYEAFNIQVQGLMRRMAATKGERLVIGVSGGLDSTQALLVACRAFDRLNLPRTNILGFTMPGFATSDGTKSNAWALMKALGVTGAEIDIRPAAEQMFRDIGHPYAAGEPVHDITFENVQAGLRTDYLFRLANQNRAFVLGTGDLSELALGWATYGVGDHMSHYNVNGGVAKTLIRHLIRWVADRELVGAEASPTLHAILNTEISPELVPAKDGAIQSTEGTVGPYALNDFFLFYISRFGMAPSKVAFLAHQAWSNAGAGQWPVNTPDDEKVEYDLATIKAWLRKFLIRFFQTAQFKRSALPNGPKVVTGGSLSPRGDWRAPSDGNARVWLDELEANVPD
ncbi:NAD(+) synthase [Brevundimonas sp. Bb-A]|uniref:NAD(+) synthase n=1 Tax=Brevundimonas sp. Bb-A TaxID=2560058 RepID=UPI00128EA125|nr:NAD(+) synthase [Brevundimonas sp. Bb-A]QFU30181.1 Glutamine-dependent NAD(+) synthetase [Brevundimonas sp. Bb-A]